MFKISKKLYNSAKTSLLNLKRARKNCKYLKSGTKIRSRWDVCFFEIVDDTLTVTMDGSSRLLEFMNNLFQFGWFRKKREDEKDRHFGGARSGNLLYDNFRRKCPDLRNIEKVHVEGKSRGGWLALQFTERLVSDYHFHSPPVVNTFGCPEMYEKDLARHFQRHNPFIHNRFILEKDFVPHLGLNLHHWETNLILMPTVKGKIDHLAYNESLAMMEVVK